MNKPFELTILDKHHRLGWAEEATAVTPLLALTGINNNEWTGCKRDDQCTPLMGGTKVRKLDFLLASAPFSDSEYLATMGAIGSGHVVACCAAAKALGRKIVSHLFWEPLSPGVPENLSYIASVSDKIYFYNSRVSMALNNPALFLKPFAGGCAIIPPGSTNPAGMLGTVRAGLELAAQVRAGEIPQPGRVYVALGTGGTVAGLSIGFALGGLAAEIHAVTTVESILSTKFRMQNLVSGTKKLLVSLGHKNAGNITPARIIINRKYVGAGYGHPTAKSLQAMELMKKDGVNIEPVYTGKAAAAMIDDIKNGFNAPLLFWNSMRANLPPVTSDWKNNLPEKLRRKLDE